MSDVVTMSVPSENNLYVPVSQTSKRDMDLKASKAAVKYYKEMHEAYTVLAFFAGVSSIILFALYTLHGPFEAIYFSAFCFLLSSQLVYYAKRSDLDRDAAAEVYHFLLSTTQDIPDCELPGVILKRFYCV